MEQNDEIAKILNANNGILKTSAAKLSGISNKELRRLVDAGVLERVGRGLYISETEIADEYLLAQLKCGKGVFSHETALYFHGLSDRTPLKLMLTIPSGFNTRLLKDRVAYRFFYCKTDIYPLGITETTTPFGNKVQVYDIERTLCDCLKKRDALDVDLVLTAVKTYMRGNNKNFSKLLSYADTLKIRGIVRQYMEVLV